MPEPTPGSARASASERKPSASRTFQRRTGAALQAHVERFWGWVERAIGLIYRDPAAVVVETLAQQCGLSRRQLERRVTTYFGQSPVELRCLARFFHAARRLLLEPSTDTLASALALGYYDQSHFIREFKRFAGMPPEAFRRVTAKLSHFYNPPRTRLARLSFLALGAR